jgi:hypothetical protein
MVPIRPGPAIRLINATGLMPKFRDITTRSRSTEILRKTPPEASAQRHGITLNHGAHNYVNELLTHYTS